MNAMTSKVNDIIEHAKKWKEEYKKLRMIALNSELSESLKWGVPCYTYENSNVVLIHGFKEYCAFLFIKGALLRDSNQILVQQTENVQAGRQIRFSNVQEIIELEPILNTYIKEAIEIEKSGLKVEFKKDIELKYPEEFQNKLADSLDLKKAFDSLTPGRRRAYNFYFSAPKQSKTRESRIEKYTQKILDGKGLDD